VLRLLRIGTLFSPAADVVASICLAGLPWSGAAVAAVAASVCLYAAGMVWNDVADRRLDAVQRPERPLPSGALSLAFAVSLGVALLALGLCISPCRLHHGTIAVLVLAYDFLGKRIDWLGALGMGALRGLNLGTGLALGGETIGPAAQQAVLVAACCYAVYIVAVTILGIFEDTPRVGARAVAAVQAAPLLAALGALVFVQGGLWPAPAIAAVPAGWALFRANRIRTWDQAAIRRSMTILLLGTMVFTALLALAAGRPAEAVGIAAAIVPARWIARRIALT
jgi:4-hydroxybenzoate polyprenyltransferase